MVVVMYCKKCGAALPSHGYICKSCGAMMDTEQIKMQKNLMREQDDNKTVQLLSDKYTNNTIDRDYKKHKENKYLGALLIILVIIIIIIIAVLKVM